VKPKSRGGGKSLLPTHGGFAPIVFAAPVRSLIEEAAWCRKQVQQGPARQKAGTLEKEVSNERKWRALRETALN